MTLFKLFNEGVDELKKAGVKDPETDVRMLLLKAFSLELSSYILNRGEELPDDEDTKKRTERYRENIKRRTLRMPVQQILGETEFMGLTFSVNPDVLIPRQDTETLVEQVMADCKDSHSLLDLCTGSGCIAVSLSVKGPFFRVAATDISEAALNTARENAARYGLFYMEFYQGDLFEALPAKAGPFDVITANPPYIPSGEIEKLMPEVRFYEPRTALDGATDGLIFYRRIAEGAKSFLAPDGRMYLEIGYDQAKPVADIFNRAGYGSISIYKDLAGNDRVVKVSV